MLYLSKYDSPLGRCFLVSDETHLQGLWIEGQENYRKTLDETKLLEKETGVILEAKKWLDEYFAGKPCSVPEILLAPQGNEFRQSVWKHLCEIPYGELTTYGEIAKKVAMDLGKERMSAQAVGGAVGRNPISIIIPCHRVIGKNGSLTGYHGGLDKKIKLLEIEGIKIR